MLLPALLSSHLRGKTYAVVHLAELHLASSLPISLSSPRPSLCKIYSQQKVVEGTTIKREPWSTLLWSITDIRGMDVL